MNAPREIFEVHLVVNGEDIDELGHVNNVVYVRWVQDAAVAHWRAAASAEDQKKLIWIVLRHEIDYKQPAVLNDRAIARTWVGPATRVKFERNTEIVRAEDGAVLAQARTIWCPLDAKTGRPSAVSPAVRAIFSIPEHQAAPR